MTSFAKSHWQAIWRQRRTNKVNNFARRAYVKIRKKRLSALLDLGCGEGQDSLYFASHGLRVTALDQVKVKAETLARAGIRFMEKDVRQMTFPVNSFDVVYAHLSLHFFRDAGTQKIFKKIHKVLKPGGLFFVKCKSTDDLLFGKGRKIADNIYFNGHLRHFFSKEYMRQNLRGFKIISLRKTASVYRSYKSSFIEAVATK